MADYGEDAFRARMQRAQARLPARPVGGPRVCVGGPVRLVRVGGIDVGEVELREGAGEAVEGTSRVAGFV